MCVTCTLWGGFLHYFWFTSRLWWSSVIELDSHVAAPSDPVPQVGNDSMSNAIHPVWCIRLKVWENNNLCLIWILCHPVWPKDPAGQEHARVVTFSFLTHFLNCFPWMLKICKFRTCQTFAVDTNFYTCSHLGEYSIMILMEYIHMMFFRKYSAPLLLNTAEQNILLENFISQNRGASQKWFCPQVKQHLCIFDIGEGALRYGLSLILCFLQETRDVRVSFNVLCLAIQ